MRLTEREIELLTSIPKRRRESIRSAWLGLAIAVAGFVAFQHFGPQYASASPFLGMLMVFSVGVVAKVHFRVTPEDKLIELLHRYISRDPDAVRQISMQAVPHSGSLTRLLLEVDRTGEPGRWADRERSA